MNGDAGFLDILIELFRFLVSISWMLFAILLDWTRNAGPFSSAAIVILLCVGALGMTALMQGRLNRAISDPEREEEGVNLFLHEAMFTLPGLMTIAALAPFFLAIRITKGVVRTTQSLFAKKQKERESSAEVDPRDSIARGPEEGAGRAATAEEETAQAPVLVATIVPSLLTAATLCAMLYIAGVLTEPILASSLDLSTGLSAWEFLLLGDRPELQWYVPLSRFPWLGAVLTIFFWMTLWWWTARVTRLIYFRELGRNLVSDMASTGVLAPWRTWFGSPGLWRPAGTYLRWARWLPLVGAPWLVLSWLSLSADPYRMSPSMFAISLLLLLSWGAHFLIEGVFRAPEEELLEEREPEVIVASTWETVFHDVKERFHLDTPHIFSPPRVVEPLALSSIDPASEKLVSPLLTELLPEPRTLTHMQYAVLRSLSLLGYVHTDPPSPRRELELGSAQGDMEEATPRHRNQIILSPEGSGKSTLAMLAACNHAIIHTRSTLVITRDDERANQLRAAIEPSTLRWNIRERRVGGDLANDLAQGIIPDIIICSLRQLVINVLDEPQTYTPFLQNVGLIIVDDVESFCGPVEAHAQLAIRRLMLRLKELLGIAQLGPESAPMLLALGTDSMHDTPAWARTLCGVDAVARYFDYSNEEATLREDALKAYHGISSKKPEATGDAESEDPWKQAARQDFKGTYQLIYRLNDFRDSDGDTLDVRDLIESCERHGVPWHYRPCGDERRHLGRQRLHLRDEPRYHVHSPLDAGVVFLQGHWAEVERELARLKRAGADFDPVKTPHGPVREEEKKTADTREQIAVPVAIITLVDRDEEMALTELNTTSSLKDVLSTLPRPVVRAPQGRAVLEHLSAEITSNWVEVKDVLDIFGNPVSTTLTRLADSGMLMSEERVDLNHDVQIYEHSVYVRATSRAIGSQEPSSRTRTRTSSPLLPPRVSQVELPSGDKVSIRDRTNLNLIETADASSAHHVYYMGRIFEHAQGRFVVVAHGVRDDEQAAQELISNDILVEPYLGDGISSPRRRIWVYHCDEADALERHHTPYHPAMTARCSRKEELPAAEPLLIGEFPVATALASASCIIEPVATFRLGEKLGDVRQRLLFDEEQRQRSTNAFHTMAMALYPNPSSPLAEPDPATTQGAPRLRLDAARLIAAAMRAVLPSIYRGASFSIEVALHLDSRNPSSDQELASHEGFYFYDPQPGGTGAARALHRDGPELLLRLCRVYIERVLYHDRLRARYDHWGDEQEVYASPTSASKHSEAREPRLHDTTSSWFMDIQMDVNEHLVHASGSNTQEEGDEPEASLMAPPDLTRDRDRDLRRRALIWLDSRLRPEGSLSGGRRSGSYGSGLEDGEGDLWDIGRCWYSASGEVVDLLWTKHRWRLDEAGGEAMVDVGFDRRTAAASRFFHPQSERLATPIDALAKQLQNGAFALEDQTVWGTPRPVWILDDDPSGVPVSSDGSQLAAEEITSYQLLMSAIAMHDFAALEPLAMLLRDRSFTDLSTLAGRVALIDYVARFVQGIPSTSPSSPRGGLRPPVNTILQREGDSDSKALLLAILLRHCGFDTGLFVSLEPAQAMCAVAVVEGGDGEGTPQETMAALEQWRDTANLHGEQILFGELPTKPGQGTPQQLDIYVSVDAMRDLAPGISRQEHPETWLFVPLAAAWLKAGVYDELAREEAAAKAAAHQEGTTP